MNRFLKNELSIVLLFSMLLGLLVGYACSTGRGPRVIDVRTLSQRVDISELTPSESKRLERVVNKEASPCGDDVTLAESLFNPENCPLAPSAGRFIVDQIKEDYTEDEISKAYLLRFGAVKGMEIPQDGSPIKGAKKPVITFVIFSDFQCPFCAKAADKLDAMIRRHPDRYAVVYKNFPLATIHPQSELAARAGFAALQQGKFWEMHDMLFTTLGTELNRERIDMIAEGLGLDMDQFATDFASAAATATIENDRKLGESLGVHGTPAIFINGRPVDPGGNAIEERVKEELLREKLLSKRAGQ